MPRRRRSDETEWRARVGNGGWVVVEGGDARVVVRVHPDESNRYRVRELHLLDTGEPITAEHLRALRVAAVEQLLNLPEERAEIDKRLTRRRSVDLESVIKAFAEVGQPRTVYGKSSTTWEVKASTSGSVTPGLRVPAVRGYDDGFYEQVAEAYRRAIRAHRSPVMAIAAEAGVPRTTAARWVKVARGKGKLPKTNQGKALG
jgi:hypothetical protein